MVRAPDPGGSTPNNLIGQLDKGFRILSDRLKRYKTLIVDDSPIFLEWLRNSLDEAENFQIIGQATNGVAAIALAQELEPDLLITDFFLPDIDGLEVAIALRSALPNLTVVITSSYDVEVYAALEASNQTATFLPKAGLNVSALRTLLSGAEEQ